MGDAAFPLAKVSAHDVVQKYYELRQHYVKNTKWPHQTKKPQAYAVRFIAWCETHDVDPYMYMEARFRTFASKPDGRYPSLASMRSPQFLERWDVEAGRLIRDRLHTNMRPVERTDGERAVIRLLQKPTQVEEKLRARYLTENKPRICLAEREYTGGYDPRSKHCPNCPLKHDCLLAINHASGFDVGALRVHLFTRLPASVAEIARRVNAT